MLSFNHHMNTNESILIGDNVSRHDATQHDMSRHTLTIKQASLLFSQLGVPRSPRSVQRFCELNNIDAIRVKGEKTERYFINRESVERYAQELQQLENISHIEDDIARHEAPQRDTTRHDAPPSVTHEGPDNEFPSGHEKAELRECVVILEKEKLQLAIDRAAKEQVINQMLDERREWLGQLTQQSREIGRLEMQVKQLNAPKDDLSRHVAIEDIEPAAKIPPASPQTPMVAEAILPSPTLVEEKRTKRSAWKKIFG